MHRAVANAPDLFAAYTGMARSIRRAAQVPRRDRELAILRTLQIEHGLYEIDQHTNMALSCGITPAQISAIPAWQASGLFDAQQQAVLAWTEQIATPAGSDDKTYAALARFFHRGRSWSCP